MKVKSRRVQAQYESPSRLIRGSIADIRLVAFEAMVVNSEDPDRLQAMARKTRSAFNQLEAALLILAALRTKTRPENDDDVN